jgi:hypothetical protein
MAVRIEFHRKFDLSDKELLWCQNLLSKHPHFRHYIDNCATLDDSGKIIEFVPVENMPLEILYFLMVVSVNQRLRMIDSMVAKKA